MAERREEANPEKGAETGCLVARVLLLLGFVPARMGLSLHG